MLVSATASWSVATSSLAQIIDKQTRGHPNTKKQHDCVDGVCVLFFF